MQALGGVWGAPWDNSSHAYCPPHPSAPALATHIPWAKPDAPRAAERIVSESVSETWGNTPQRRSKVRERRDGRLRRRSDVTRQCEQGAEARRGEAAEEPEQRHVREFEFDQPARSTRRAVGTGGTAPGEKPLDETVSGEGPAASE